MCDVAYLQMAQVATQAYGQAENVRHTTAAANSAFADANAALGDRMAADNRAATDQMTARSRQAMAEVGSLQTILADSGMSGASHDRIVADAERSAAADLTTMERNRLDREQQSYHESQALDAQRRSRINGVAHPNLIGTGLQIMGAGVDARSRAGGGSTGRSNLTINWNAESGLG